MAITVYTSLDAGAPVLPALSSQRIIDNLKVILMACLVNGYSGKPAAGWTVGHEHADGFSLSNGEGYINFVHASSTAFACYLMESITDGTTALAGGYNRRSGPWFDGQTTATRQYFYSSSYYGTNPNKQWMVVADDKTAIVMLTASSSPAIDVGSSYGGALYFGRYLSWFDGTGFCCLGGGSGMSSSPVLTANNNYIGTALRNPFTGLVDQGSAPGYRVSLASDNANSAIRSRSKFYLNRLRPIRQSLLGYGAGLNGGAGPYDAVFCGLLRGMLQDPMLGDTYAQYALPLLGVASPGYNDRIKPITWPDGKVVMPLYPNTSDGGMFVSLDPADWS